MNTRLDDNRPDNPPLSDILEILDLAESGQVQLAFTDADGVRNTAPPAPFPFAQPDGWQDELAWYFTEYLLSPFGEAETQAQSVQSRLQGLGLLLFEAVFRSGPESESLLTDAAADGRRPRLHIVSPRAEFLAFPWEWLAEANGGLLAGRLSAISRRFAAGPLEPFDGPADAAQLRVLLLSGAAPGAGLAAESLDAMDGLEVEVELEVLRPPTIAALEERLAGRPGHYHLLHLDGFAAGPDGLSFRNSDGEPENDGAETESVTSGRLAAALHRAGIPAVLLTGAGGPQTDALAQSLAVAGAPGVALAPFPLRGSGRRLFAQGFYAAIARGAGAAAAIDAARRALSEHPHRPSGRGAGVSWDWTTPLAYESREFNGRPIQPRPAETAIPGMLPATPEPPPRLLPQSGPYGLIGRAGELRELESVLHRHGAALLAGDVGGGKSELALGLARWLEKSGGRPGGVVFTRFDVGAGLEKALHETGTALAGLEFGDLNSADRRRWLLDYLRQNEALLVWDQVENLAGFPDGAPGLLNDTELAELDQFLGELLADGGRTQALLVSRRESESWLTAPHSVYRLDGLTAGDRVEFATRLIEEAQVDPVRLGPEFGELLELTGGHPLALEVAVPLLNETPAPALLSELRAALAPPQPSPGDDGRPAILTALLEQAFARMPRRSRTHLPFLSLFRSRVMLDILTHITQENAYKSVLGETLGWGAGRTLLRSARAAGFLEPVTPSVYQIHPALPWFLGRALYRQTPPARIAELEAEFVRVYADTADYFMETLYENQDAGSTAILAEEGNLTQALALAMEAGQWDNAQLLAQPIAQVYRMQKRYPELRRLRAQLLEPLGASASDAAAKGASELWLYLIGTEAGQCLETGELERAEQLNRQLLEHLLAQDGGETDPRTAAVYHQMGQVCLQRWQLAEAAQWLEQSLALIEGGDDRAPVADDYYALGQVRQYQRRYADAKQLYSQALEIHQRLEDAEEMVKDYRALGLCSQFRFEYQEAESWYHRAREILEEARDEETAILVYHSLGTVGHAQYQFDDAENWYMQALTLSDRLGNEAQMAVEFHHLGLLAQARQLFPEDAENWYTLALEKFEKLGDWRGAGDECRQLGLLFHEQQRLDEAESWYHRAREIFEEIRDASRIARTYGQLGMAAEERGDLEAALTWAARTYQLAAENGLPVIAQAGAHLARLRERQGPAEFARWWQEFAGQPPPDLEAPPAAPPR